MSLGCRATEDIRVRALITLVLSQRMSILENGGRTADFIDNLLRDEKQWMIFRALLDDHMQKARSLLQDFKDHRYLFEEAMEYRKDQKGRAMSFESKAINDLSKIIEDFEFEVGEVIENLDLKKHEMIQLVSLHPIFFRDPIPLNMSY